MLEKIQKFFFRKEDMPPRSWFNWTAVVAVAFTVLGGLSDAVRSYHSLVERHVGAFQAFMVQVGILIVLSALMCFLWMVNVLPLQLWPGTGARPGKGSPPPPRRLPRPVNAMSLVWARLAESLHRLGRWLRGVPAAIGPRLEVCARYGSD